MHRLITSRGIYFCVSEFVSQKSKEKGRVPKDAGQIVANSADYPDYGIHLILRIVEIIRSFSIAYWGIFGTAWKIIIPEL